MRAVSSIILIMSALVIMLYFIGYSITRELSMYFINVIVGFFAVAFISILVHISSFILLTFNFSKKLNGINIRTINIQNEEELFKKLHDKIGIDNIVKHMDKEEFMEFLDTDGYGNKNPNPDYILNLLKHIKDRPEYENHEKWIYEKLSNLKRGTND